MKAKTIVDVLDAVALVLLAVGFFANLRPLYIVASVIICTVWIYQLLHWKQYKALNIGFLVLLGILFLFGVIIGPKKTCSQSESTAMQNTEIKN